MKAHILLVLLLLCFTALSLDREFYAVGDPIQINTSETLTIESPSASYTLLNPSSGAFFPALEPGEHTFRTTQEEVVVYVANQQQLILNTSRGPLELPALLLPNGKQISPPGFQNMLFRNLNTNDIRITPNLQRTWDFTTTFAVDPTPEGFGEVDITRIATGSSLYKCEDYDYFNENCFGNWVFVQQLTPGQPYTITVTGADPAFGEGDADSQPETCRLWDQPGTIKGAVNQDCLSLVIAQDSLSAALDDIEDGGNSELRLNFSNTRSIAEVNELNVSFRWQRLPVSGGGAGVGATTATLQAFIGSSWVTACTTTVPVNTWGTFVCDFSSILTDPSQANNLQVRALFDTARQGRPGDEARVLVDYTFMALDYVFLDLTPPTYDSIQATPPSPRTYAQENTVFSVNWEDDAAVDTVLIEHNFTGVFINETMTGGPGTYTFTTELGAGVYRWRSIANDTSANTNQTPPQTYVVNKATGDVQLLINNTQANITLEEGASVNVEGIRAAGEAPLSLYENGVLIATGASISETLTYPTLGTYALVLNMSESQNYTFAQESWTITVIDVTPPAAVTNLQNVSAGVSWVYWEWTNPADADFSHTIIELNGTFIANTSNSFINTTSLLADTLYELQVRTVDESGNINESTQTALGRTLESTDTTPPRIENITVTGVTDGQASITWDTDEPATSLVKYSTTSGTYTQQSFSATQVESHLRTLTGLAPSTTYFFVVNSTDAAGNTNQSQELSFTTLTDATPPQFANILSTPVSGGTFLITATFNVIWTDNTAVDTVLIEHNFTGVFINETMTGGPEYTFTTELAAGVYRWRSIANDTLGNTNTDMTLQPYTVLRAPGVANLFLNENQASISANQDTIVNLTATTNAGVVELIEDGVVLSQNTLVTTTLKSYSTPGVYTITARKNQTQNFTHASQTFTLTINDTQPPTVTLVEPFADITSIFETNTFSYIPTDNVLTTQCSLLINQTVEQTSTSITENAVNTFTQTLPDGIYEWNVECQDAAGNTAQASESRTLAIDVIRPWIPTVATFSGGGTITGLVNESDGVGQSLTSAGQFIEVSSWSETAPSNANITGVTAFCEAITATNNARNAFQFNTGSGWSADQCTSGAGQTGVLSCDLYALGVDTVADLNNLQTRCVLRRPGGGPGPTLTIDYTYVQPEWTLVQGPDFAITNSDITVPTGATEGQPVQINATVRNEGTAGATALVRFIDDTTSTTIGEQSQTIPAGEERIFSVAWHATIGRTNLRVIVDPEDIVSELDETNNQATATIDVDAWQTYFGTLLQRLRILADGTLPTYNWSVSELDAHVLIHDDRALINYLNLHALTRTTTGTFQFEDLALADDALGMTGFVDSINATFSDGAGGLTNTGTFTLFGTTITDVPLVQTSGPFSTGVLWDADDSTSTEYEGGVLVFVTQVNLSQTGLFGTYDYELFVPALLRRNLGPDGQLLLSIEIS